MFKLSVAFWMYILIFRLLRYIVKMLPLCSSWRNHVQNSSGGSLIPSDKCSKGFQRVLVTLQEILLKVLETFEKRKHFPEEYQLFLTSCKNVSQGTIPSVTFKQNYQRVPSCIWKVSKNPITMPKGNLLQYLWRN